LVAVAVAVALAVAVAMAGSGRVLLAGLPRWAVVVVAGRGAVVRVTGRRALVVVAAFRMRGLVAVVLGAAVRVSVPRQSGRNVMPVADRAAAWRSLLLLGQPGRDGVPVSNGAAAWRRSLGRVVVSLTF